MDKMIAFCGLDCAQCEAYLATQANDEGAKEKIAENWRKQFNAPDITAASINCDGCTQTGKRLVGYCNVCEIRTCAIKKGVKNCAFCEEYAACPKLNGFIKNVPAARANLEQIRTSL